MSTTPQFSVVTAALNRFDHLERCIESVARQRDIAVEHIVIDGGSTDGSVDILQRWNDRLRFWSSEPDKGIGDAMNKGLAKATGTWALFLHADDQLLGADTLARVAEILDVSNARIAGFPILFGSENQGRLIRPRGAGHFLRLKTGFLHQGTFIQRSLFEDIGLHNVELRIAMDYEFFLRAWLRGVPMATFSEPVVSWMGDSGISSQRDWGSLRKRFAEERAVQDIHATSPWQRAAYAAYWSLYLPYRRLRCLFTKVS